MFHVYWPLSAFVTLMIVLFTIIILLRYGPVLCKTRHTALPDDREWEDKTYDQQVGYELA